MRQAGLPASSSHADPLEISSEITSGDFLWAAVAPLAETLPPGGNPRLALGSVLGRREVEMQPPKGRGCLSIVQALTLEAGKSSPWRKRFPS